MQEAHVVIAGLGGTGLSVARYLLARGTTIAVTDTRADPPGLAELRRMAPAARVSLGRLDPALLEGASLVVASPGLPATGTFFELARARGVEVTGDIELFARAAQARIAGITGTNGKSTVTSLVAEMGRRAGLATRAGGNLGPPALDLLDGTPADLYVLELSSYQLETTTSLAPDAAAVLNVTPDHMDRYATMADYAGAKARLFERCGTAVVNLDDPLVAAMPRGRTLTFSLRADAGADYALVGDGADAWLACGGERVLPVSGMRIQGRHNAANALAGLALADALGLPRGAACEALREFPGLPHRAQWVADVGGVRYVNDSKGTNVGATLAAVDGLAGPLVVIAGGDGKGQDFAPLRSAFRGKVRHVLLIGRDASQLAAALGDACGVEFCANLEAAVRAARAIARPGDTVLLSPACASLDMFRDYAHRGAVFASAVRELAA